MSYYSQVLQPGEQVRYVGRLHWIIYAWSIVALITGSFILGGAIGISSDDDPQSSFPQFLLEGLSLIFILYGLAALVSSVIKRSTTEIVVTDRRVIHKVGLFSRRTVEMNIGKIETVDVLQGIAGRVLGFGTILIRGTGSGLEPLKRVETPIDLRNAIVAS